MRYRFGACLLDTDRFELAIDGQATTMEPGVFKVLAYLIENAGRVVPKHEILDEVWGDRFVSESTLSTRIKQARQAVGDDGRQQAVIQTVHGQGYMFRPQPEVLGVDDAGAEPHPGSGQSVGGESATTDPAVPVAQTISVDDEFPFVGRADELADVLDAGRGRPSGPTDGLPSASRIVCIGGPPGVGKSRLAIEALQVRAEAGWLTAAGRCGHQVTEAFQPVREAIAFLARSQPAFFATCCAGMEDLVVRAIPSAADHLGVTVTADDTVHSIHEVLLMILDRVSGRQPLAVLIDDIHWSDEPTRSLVTAVGRRLGDRPVEFYATFRSTTLDLGSDVRAWIDQLIRSAPATRVDLGDLGSDAVAALTTSVLGPEGDAASIFRQTGGHSLFVVETLRDRQLGRQGTLTVAELVAARVGLLDQQARGLVEASALLGTEFNFADACAVAQLTPTDGLAAVEAALGAGLILETAAEDRFRFAHQLIPEAVAADLTGPARAGLHARCALAIQARGGDEVAAAFHRLGAAPLIPVDDAVASARSAADRAIDRRQFDRAVRLLDRVLESRLDDRTRAEVQLAAGSALNTASRVAEAVPRFEEAAELSRRHHWPDLLAEAAIGHWERSPFRARRDRTTLALLAEATEAVNAGNSDGDDLQLRRRRWRQTPVAAVGQDGRVLAVLALAPSQRAEPPGVVDGDGSESRSPAGAPRAAQP